MCGINGLSWQDGALIATMNRAISHRGPDDSGVFLGDGVSLGQLRLSIIDLSSAGHQPMWYDPRSGASSEQHHAAQQKEALAGVVFNGEIYNFQEIREELVAKGYVFTTRSDTEVILASYLEWGTSCVQRFNGMWAFCIFDRRKRLFFCSRDKVGKKPFYYSILDGKFSFSSELKGLVQNPALPREILPEAVELYFALGFVPAPLTIYRHARKLEARENLTFDLQTGQLRTWQYYELPACKPIRDREALISEGKKLLHDAVRLRMISDVPVGAFLSGGLDSSTVVALMKKNTKRSKLHTFSIGFEGRFDETPYIETVKNHLHTIHHHYYFTEKDFEELLPTYSWMYDEPFGDYSGFPQYKVSQLARERVTVSLSGDGGDEVFGGYATHVLGNRMDLIRSLPAALRKLGGSLPVKKNLNSVANIYLLKEAFKLSLHEPEEFYAASLPGETLRPAAYKKWSTKRLRTCLALGDGKLGEALRIYDLLYYTLPDLFLTKVDRASMAHALEVRSPFLDYRLIEFAQRIPTAWKQDLFKTKILMRDIIKDILPTSIVNRGKQGFSPPVEDWILRERYVSRLSDGAETLKGLGLHALAKFFEEKVLREPNKVYTTYRIRLFIFQLWMERWMNR